MNMLPIDVLVVIGCFMRIDALARARETCTTLCVGLAHAWHDALFVPNGKWYELKDVALAAKYMSWTGRVPSPPPTLDTMDNIAFWGILVDGDRLLATIGPKVVTFETNIPNAINAHDDPVRTLTLLWGSDNMEYTWVDTKTEQEYTTQMFFSKQCQIKMYAAVKLSSGVGVYELISGQMNVPDRSNYEFDFDDRDNPTDFPGTLNVAANGVVFFIFDKTTSGFPTEWYDEYCDASPTKRLEMETAFVQSATNAGRGWNSTRRDVLEQFVAQLH